jgi:hypothetical protein
VRLIFEDPPALAERFADFLRDYWEAAFRDEWEALEPRLAEAVAEAGRTMAPMGSTRSSTPCRRSSVSTSPGSSSASDLPQPPHGRRDRGAPAAPRLRPVQLISERPRSTQELAPLLGISRAGCRSICASWRGRGSFNPVAPATTSSTASLPERIDALSDAVRQFVTEERPRRAAG